MGLGGGGPPPRPGRWGEASVGLPPNSRVGPCPPVGLGKHNSLWARSGLDRASRLHGYL
jgi:hypothetical protein